MYTNLHLTTDPIPKLIRLIAVPASIGYFFNTMFNVVDTYFGGSISTQALASLSLTLPVFFIILALGTGFSTGSTALIATALGAEKEEEAAVLAVQALVYGLFLSVVVTIFGLIASPFLFRVLGAKQEYLATALEYMSTIFSGSVCFLTVYMLNSILQAVGDTKSFRNFLILGFFLNILLDPWFIYGGFGLPAMSFRGIALATVVVQFTGCLYLGRRVMKSGLISRADLIRNLRPQASVFKEITRQGLPASVNMATIGVGMFVITYYVSRYGEAAVAGYGTAMRVEQIALLPGIGLQVATLTLVAQNDGARIGARIIEALNKSLLYGGIIMAVGLTLVMIFAPWLMTLFTDDAKVIGIGSTYLRIDALVFYAYVILSVHIAALQGVKRPMFAIWAGLYRQIAAPLVVFWVLSDVLGLGLVGVWWGIFFTTWSAALVALFYARRVIAARISQYES